MVLKLKSIIIFIQIFFLLFFSVGVWLLVQVALLGLRLLVLHFHFIFVFVVDVVSLSSGL